MKVSEHSLKVCTRDRRRHLGTEQCFVHLACSLCAPQHFPIRRVEHYNWSISDIQLTDNTVTIRKAVNAKLSFVHCGQVPDAK